MRHSTLSIICVVAMLFIGLAAPLAMANDGRQTNATVSFGQWQADPESDPPLDRLLGNPLMGIGNNHELIPKVVKIKAGGAVNFIISGLHNVAVYDDGTLPAEIDTTLLLPGAGGGIINDPTNRIYRGVDPNATESPSPLLSLPSRDRVEVVLFPKPGKYLVICGVRNHFVEDDMFGFVVVREEDDDDDED
jgi:plastocyanin